ncbi:MAG: methionyl-tRNA formyltransferase [Gammaproteobacteria bacterium]|nr:methionyl-tRNA formyltransferase [Gammaproteobacteria bacterium]
MKKVIILAAEQRRFDQLEALLGDKNNLDCHRICLPAQLTVEKLAVINPDYVFFPHWSVKVPRDIYEHYPCVMFHMTDLPYGRGGSPLQNLIVRGHKETEISAFKCDEGIDTGPVYLKNKLSLSGTAEEIFNRAIPVIAKMIEEIVANEIIPLPQQGKTEVFMRRKPEDGELSGLDSIEQVYDYIRMLDADGYPRAFLETNEFKFEFENARLIESELLADVKVTRKN